MVYVICNITKYSVCKRLLQSPYFTELLKIKELDHSGEPYAIMIFQKEFIKLNVVKINFDYENIYLLIRLSRAMDYFQDKLNIEQSKRFNDRVTIEIGKLNLTQICNLRYLISNCDQLIYTNWQDWIATYIEVSCGFEEKHPGVVLRGYSQSINLIYKTLLKFNEENLIDYWRESVKKRTIMKSQNAFKRIIRKILSMPNVLIDWTNAHTDEFKFLHQIDIYNSRLKPITQEQRDTHYIVRVDDLPLECRMCYWKMNNYVSDSWHTLKCNPSAWLEHSIYQLHQVQISSW